MQPRESWSVEFVAKLVEWAQRQENLFDMRCYLFGHSAGGQFLSRVAAYALPKDIQPVVIANLSTYVLPSATEDAPYGFHGLWNGAELRRQLRQYLAAPLTIFLGLKDTGDRDLTRNEAAERHGKNRLERGQHVFKMGRCMAEENGWPFNWRIVCAEGVGHTSGGMLNAEEVSEAFGFGASWVVWLGFMANLLQSTNPRP